MRSVWIISLIIAIALTTSAFSVSAQQVDQGTRQKIEQITAAFHDTWNNHDAAGNAALYTKDGILVVQAPQAVYNGQQEIAQSNQKAFAAFPHHDSATADQIIPLGPGEVMVVGRYQLTGKDNNKISGHWTAVDVPEDGKLKIRMQTVVPDLPAQSNAR